MLICRANGTNESLTKRLVFQVLLFLVTSCKILSKYHFNYFFLFIFFNYKNRIIYEKKIMGTSDAWSMICLSHRPGEPAYYIVDWQILNFKLKKSKQEVVFRNAVGFGF